MVWILCLVSSYSLSVAEVALYTVLFLGASTHVRPVSSMELKVCENLLCSAGPPPHWTKKRRKKAKIQGSDTRFIGLDAVICHERSLDIRCVFVLTLERWTNNCVGRVQ